MKRIFNIHGENIVECERAFALIQKSLKLENVNIKPETSVFCPTYTATSKNDDFTFTFYPGYGRWNYDILQLLHTSKDSLREAPDILITEVKENKELPLLAIEYCSALPAGNQAWQRSGRGYSTGMSKVPYLYIAELGGYELDKNRNRKAARLPNPAIPFSYLSYSKESSMVLPVYEKSPGCDEESAELYKDVFSEKELIAITADILNEKDYSETEKELENKVISFIQIKAATSRGTVTLNEEQWKLAYDVINKNESLITFLCKNNPVKWGKKISIPITESATKFKELTQKYAIGITSSNLPMCIIPRTNQDKFVKIFETIYPNLSADFKKWLEDKDNLVIVFVAGFKPRGDDARPDRGLVPFARMLVGNKAKILTFVYGPAPKETFSKIETEPHKLKSSNGLWEAIISASDALLIDSRNAPKNKKYGLLKGNLQVKSLITIQNNVFVSTIPKKIGENDVDTILHTLLTHLQNIDIFEGMCNPPGGDWSGISVFVRNDKTEYRWLSLPRVSHTEAKRPDHVFQLFGICEKPILFSIESKEKASDLEENIGERLNRYLQDLLKTAVNAKRKENSDWEFADELLSEKNFEFASAAAYILKNETDLEIVEAKVKTDLIFSYIFSEDGSCKIKVTSYSKIGEKVAATIKQAKNPLANLSLLIV